MDNLIFKNKNLLYTEYDEYFDGEIISDFTIELDRLAGFKIHPEAMMKHYIQIPRDLNYRDLIGNYSFSIIVANIEVGKIYIDNNVLTDFKLNQNIHPLIHYSETISCLNKYIGKSIEIILDKMVLKNRRTFDDQFICDLTKDIDKIVGIKYDHILEDYGHYIYIGNYERNHLNEPLAIRVPGCTTGAIWLDDDHKITKIELYNGRIIKYPSDINETMKKYIGVELEL